MYKVYKDMKQDNIHSIMRVLEFNPLSFPRGNQLPVVQTIEEGEVECGPGKEIFEMKLVWYSLMAVDLFTLKDSSIINDKCYILYIEIWT